MTCTTSVVVQYDPLPGLRQINALLLGVTPGHSTALLFRPWWPLEVFVSLVSAFLGFVLSLPYILFSVLTHIHHLTQTLLLHPFIAMRRSVYGDQIFWEYASVTFSLLTAAATLNASAAGRILLERVMPIEQWALWMLFVGLIQLLTIPLGSNRSRAISCVLALILWIPLLFLYVRRIGWVGPAPGLFVFALGNYLHIFRLLRTPDRPQGHSLNSTLQEPTPCQPPSKPTST